MRAVAAVRNGWVGYAAAFSAGAEAGDKPFHWTAACKVQDCLPIDIVIPGEIFFVGAGAAGGHRNDRKREKKKQADGKPRCGICARLQWCANR